MKEAFIRIQHEQKMWIKHEWMKVWKLNSTVLQFWSCIQALSADVCQAVPYEAPLWAALLLVHYGWGSILRHQGCCVLIFELREMTPGCCQILSWCLYCTWWVQTCRYSMCSHADLIPVWSMLTERKDINKLSLISHQSYQTAFHTDRHCSLCRNEAQDYSLHYTLYNVWYKVCLSCQCKYYQ